VRLPGWWYRRPNPIKLAALRPDHYRMERRRLAAGIVGAALIGTLVASVRADGVTTLTVAAANAVVLAATMLLTTRRHDARPAASLDDRLSALVEHSAEVVMVIDPRGRNLYVSPSVERCLGWSPGEFAAFRADEMIHSNDYARALDAIAEIHDEPHGHRSVEVRIRSRRDWRWAEVGIRNETADAVIGGFIVTMRDITTRRQHAEVLAARATQQGAIAHLSRRALEGADPSELAREATEAVVAGLGVQRSALFRAMRGHDQLLLAAVGGSDTDGEPSTVPLDRSTLVWSAMLHPAARCVVSDGRVVPFGTDALVGTGLAILVAGKSRRYGVLTARSPMPRTFTPDDVNFLHAVANALALAIERRGAEEEAHHRALQDPLTALPNRVMFLDRLDRALGDGKLSGRYTAVFFVDLDKFKVVNDTLGHSAGDAMLIGVANALRDTLRPGDLVARFGGDEFTVLCEHLTELSQAQRIAERIAESLRTPVPFGDHQLTITASIGFVLSDPTAGADQADALIKRADTAMYQAKESGRNQIIHDEVTASTLALPQLRTADDLHHAVESEQLFLEYQPIIDLVTHRADSAEALVRWRHPDRGVVPPSELIPTSEDTGMIEEVGGWVIAAAAAQTLRWRQAGHAIVTSINVSPRQLLRVDFVDSLAAILRHTGCHPQWLCLEIPEAAMVSDLPGTAAGIEGIRRLGVRAAIDDFGTGYSSLTYLRRLAVDVLKVERGMLHSAMVDADDRHVLAAIVGLARSLRLDTVAVGVETHEELALARQLGFSHAQGYLFSRPTPAAADGLHLMPAAPTSVEPVVAAALPTAVAAAIPAAPPRPLRTA
jgi:diguanylate cyclase (GGDEF)-like protein/PAS domain S-box-containing protein